MAKRTRHVEDISVANANITSREEISPTKERILEVAEKLFAQKGFEGTRTRDIAEQAGINISTLHFHWKSKEDLYTAVYQRQVARRAKLAEEIFSLLAQAPSAPQRWPEIERGIVEHLFEFFQRYSHAARLDSYRLLEVTAPNAALQQGQALLFSVAEQLRGLLPKELANAMDVQLSILSLNALLREYFTGPEVFRRLLGEQDSAVIEKRLRLHVQQNIARLFPLLNIQERNSSSSR